MQRYGVSADGAVRQLNAALHDNHKLLGAHLLKDTSPIGLAWVIPRGVFSRSPYLKLLAVADTAQRTGIGSRLMNSIETALAADCDDLLLLVSDFNAPARTFYRARGYEEIGAIADSLLSDTTEIMMRKKLGATARR